MPPSLRPVVFSIAMSLVASCATAPGTAEASVESRVSRTTSVAAEEQARVRAEAEARARAAADAEAAAAAQREAEIDARLLRVADDLARIKAAPAADAPTALQLALGDLGTLSDLFNQTPEDRLKKRIKETNLRLCEATIQLVRRMSRPPEVPEEVRREVAFGMTALKRAESEAGIKEAALHFQEALRRAPWVAGVWFNFAAVLEKLEAYDDAVASLRFYLLADPQAADASAVQSKIYELEYLANEKSKLDKWLGAWTTVGRPILSSYAGSITTQGPVIIRIDVTKVTQKGELAARLSYTYLDGDATIRKYGTIGKEVPFVFNNDREPPEWSGQLSPHGFMLTWPQKRKSIGDGDVMTTDATAEVAEQDGVFRLKVSWSIRFTSGVTSSGGGCSSEIRKEDPAARPASPRGLPEGLPETPPNPPASSKK